MSDIDSDDSELKRAIALSLEEIEKHEVTDLLSDDEVDKVYIAGDDSHQRAENDQPRTTSPKPKGPTCKGSGDLSVLQPQYGLLEILGFDRKKMEEERLARLGKRKDPSISPPPIRRDSAGPHKKPVDLDVRQGLSDRPAAKKAKTLNESSLLEDNVAFSLPRHGMESTSLPAAKNDPGLYGGIIQPIHSKYGLHNTSQLQVISYRRQQNLLAPGIHFPNGVVKKTWAYGFPREDDIKIEEVLQKDDLELAVLSAFQWDEEWILGKLNLRQTKIICVVQAEGEQQKTEMRANVPSNLRFCFPSMAGQINCMHSKLQLLSHPSHLRIVVPSANLVPYDWGENGGVMENTAFIIDLPRYSNGDIKPAEMKPFCRELCYFLKAMEIEQSVIDSMRNFDFSRTAHLAFIHSIGGSHTGTNWMRTGYCGLGTAIRELGLTTKDALNVEFVPASIGSLTHDLIMSIYLAAQGDDGLTELNWRTSKPPKGKLSNTHSTRNLQDTELRMRREVEDGFRIYFPSRDTVASSKGGIGSGSTICFQPKWYESASFPRSLMRDCKSKRFGLLMHNKMIFVRLHNPVLCNGVEDGVEYVAWAYVGSANLSESAWGRLVMDKSTKQPKLNIRNWECGVVIRIARSSKFLDSDGREPKGKEKESSYGPSGSSSAGLPSMKVFDGAVPVPMVVPGDEYGMKKPWFYTEH